MWGMEGKDAAWHICATCQRFVLTGPQRATLSTDDAYRRQLSAAAAEAETLPRFDLRGSAQAKRTPLRPTGVLRINLSFWRSRHGGSSKRVPGSLAQSSGLRLVSSRATSLDLATLLRRRLGTDGGGTFCASLRTLATLYDRNMGDQSTEWSYGAETDKAIWQLENDLGLPKGFSLDYSSRARDGSTGESIKAVAAGCRHDMDMRIANRATRRLRKAS